MKNLSKFIFAVTVLVTGGVSAQNVGIGTAVPTEKLHVQGGARVTSLSGVGNRLVQSNATGVLSNFPIGINDQILTMVGGIPIWQDPFPAGANGQIWTLVGGTWQWLDPQVDNGLYYNAGAQKTRLGGPLVEQTTISHNSNHLIHNLDGTGDFIIQDAGTPHFEVRDNGISFFGGDVFWRQTSTNGMDLMNFVEDVGSGRLRIYEGGLVGADLDANSQYVFNEQGNDRDFRIESNVRPFMFLVNAGTNQVIINRATQHLGYTDYFSVYQTDNATVPFCVNGWNQGNTGGGATFQIEAGGNGYNALEATTVGTGAGAFVWRNNGGNNLPALLAQNSAGNNRWGIINNDENLALAYFVISDSRLKRDIADMPVGLSEIMKLKPVNYYLDNKTYSSFGTSNNLQYGFLAQDMAQIFPTLVAENSVMDPNQMPTDPRSDWSKVETPFSAVNYLGLIPVLTKAMQEQQVIIENQGMEIENLKQEIQEIKNLINSHNH